MFGLRDRIKPVKISDSVPGSVYFSKITKSTNFDAKTQKNVPDKSLFITEKQTQGRGRQGRDWMSQKKGISMSILLKPNINTSHIQRVTLVAGMAVARSIPNSKIKWPNDIILNGKKVAGILTEMTEVDGEIRVIVGIGINVNGKKFNKEIENIATSIILRTGKAQDRNNIVSKILNEFWELYDIFLKDGFLPLKQEYEKKCITLNRHVTIIRDGEKLPVFAKGIDAEGELLVEFEGKTVPVFSGEVSVRDNL